MSLMSSLIGNSEQFPILKKWNFFNHAGVAPVPAVAADAMRKFAEQAESTAYLNSGWYQDIELLRQTASSLIGCHRDELAFVKNTSEGISIVANGIDWQWGDRVVTTAVEYPANIYPWMEVARSRGIRLVQVPEQVAANGARSVPLDAILREAQDPRTRLVTLSAVEYASGQRHDLARIGEFCRERKILFCVDAIQAIGAIPIHVGQMGIDYLSADGHKWMLGPEGAGLFYCRRELLERTRPLMVGWMNVVDAQNYGNYDYTLRPDAGRFECGSHNLPGLLGLKAALELLSGIGIPLIAQRIKALTDLLDAGLRRKGFAVASPREAEQWSGIVSFSSAVHPHDAIMLKLRKEHHIELAVREGRLRCSPHFYNTEMQMAQLLDLLPDHA